MRAKIGQGMRGIDAHLKAEACIHMFGVLQHMHCHSRLRALVSGEFLGEGEKWLI